MTSRLAGGVMAGSLVLDRLPRRWPPVIVVHRIVGRIHLNHDLERR